MCKVQQINSHIESFLLSELTQKCAQTPRGGVLAGRENLQLERFWFCIHKSTETRHVNAVYLNYSI